MLYMHTTKPLKLYYNVADTMYRLDVSMHIYEAAKPQIDGAN